MRHLRKYENIDPYSEEKWDNDENGKIRWDKEDGSYFSDKRYELTIHKKNDNWVLSYTDFWTVGPEAFFVNIKSLSNQEMFAVPALKKYAQKMIDDRVMPEYPDIEH